MASDNRIKLIGFLAEIDQHLADAKAALTVDNLTSEQLAQRTTDVEELEWVCESVEAKLRRE